ncbi:SDR family oxidoreductase [Novosphingobium sp.]|uniref:SDR family oxidoreductase n=1 Tax=Novosphingobium sp. TaxID=1874826 RepID=UPI0028AE1165|nr:SDR family oxidoreductase [Novosphingobium sp.]
MAATIRRSLTAPVNPQDDETAAYQLGLIPLGRYGQPEDVGAAVAFLATPAAREITGAILNMVGGALT